MKRTFVFLSRIFVFLSRIIEIMIVLASVLICIGYVLSGHDNLEFGIERITNITNYTLDNEHAELILHHTNPSDSIVMVHDARSIAVIMNQMNLLVDTDDRWTKTRIAEDRAYGIIKTRFSTSYQTDQHFRPVCEISGGYYDYLFYEEEDGDIKGSLVDVDTGTVVLYIFNAN